MPEINWRELQEYRLKEIEAAALFISEIWKNRESTDYFKGVMDMFERIIQLPTSLCDEEEKDFVTDLVRQDFKRVEMDILRKVVR